MSAVAYYFKRVWVKNIILLGVEHLTAERLRRKEFLCLKGKIDGAFFYIYI